MPVKATELSPIMQTCTGQNYWEAAARKAHVERLKAQRAGDESSCDDESSWLLTHIPFPPNTTREGEGEEGQREREAQRGGQQAQRERKELEPTIGEGRY